MREQPRAALVGKSRGRRRRGLLGLLGNRTRFAQQLQRVTKPRVERRESGVGGDLRLQRGGFLGREFAHEQGGDADFEFFAW